MTRFEVLKTFVKLAFYSEMRQIPRIEMLKGEGQKFIVGKNGFHIRDQHKNLL